jgi:hypothetical protein
MLVATALGAGDFGASSRVVERQQSVWKFVRGEA